VHTIRQFNRALENGEYFYVDVIKEGLLLFDAGTTKLSKPKNLTKEQRLAKAREDHEYWTERAEKFLKYHRTAMKEEDWREAAFFLHQATEHHLTSACLVRSGYRPPGHDLVALESWAAQFDATFKDILPKATDEDIRLLELLQAAYVGARYKKAFSITPDDLHQLALTVKRLAKVVRDLPFQ
jgi:HEPN domain-containing protein